MPASYHTVHGNVWDHTFRPLSPDAKLVALYVWTSPMRLHEGLFVQPVGYVALDTGLDADRVAAAFAELESAGVLRWDAAVELVLNPLALKANPLRNGVDERTGEVKPDKRIAPAVAKLRGLPDSPLKAEFLRLAEEHSPDLAAALMEEAAKGPRKGPSEGPSKEPMEDPSRARARVREEQEREPEKEPEVARPVQQEEQDQDFGADASFADVFPLAGDHIPDTTHGDPRYDSIDDLARKRGAL